MADIKLEGTAGQQLEQIAKMAYGFGSNEGANGGAGRIGMIGSRVVKFNTHLSERLFTRTTDDMRKSCQNLRECIVRLADSEIDANISDTRAGEAAKREIRELLGMSSDGTMSRSLLDRKVVAKVLSRLSSASGKDYFANASGWKASELSTADRVAKFASVYSDMRPKLNNDLLFCGDSEIAKNYAKATTFMSPAQLDYVNRNLPARMLRMGASISGSGYKESFDQTMKDIARSNRIVLSADDEKQLWTGAGVKFEDYRKAVEQQFDNDEAMIRLFNTNASQSFAGIWSEIIVELRDSKSPQLSALDVLAPSTGDGFGGQLQQVEVEKLQAGKFKLKFDFACRPNFDMLHANGFQVRMLDPKKSVVAFHAEVVVEKATAEDYAEKKPGVFAKEWGSGDQKFTAYYKMHVEASKTMYGSTAVEDASSGE